VIVEQDRFERLAHVPFEIVGEHAQKDVGAHAVVAAMVDGPHLDVEGLEAAKGALDVGESFVGLTVEVASSVLASTLVFTT
jgi:hypothetical protein